MRNEQVQNTDVIFFCLPIHRRYVKRTDPFFLYVLFDDVFNSSYYVQLWPNSLKIGFPYGNFQKFNGHKPTTF